MEKSKFEREIVLDDKALIELVLKKGTLVDEGREMAKEMERLAKEHNNMLKKQDQLIAKVNKVKIDIVRKVEKLVDGQLDEYEVPVTTNMKDGKVVFLCADTMAEYKESFSKLNKWQQARTPVKNNK